MTWALGPWLMVFGRQTPLILPAIVLRYVPIVANARIPGRAMVVVYLAVAMLGGDGRCLADVAATTGSNGWPGVSFSCSRSSVVPRGLRFYVPDMPSQYAALRAAHIGAVCELPLGIRDGFGETGNSTRRCCCIRRSTNGRSSADSSRACPPRDSGLRGDAGHWFAAAGCRPEARCRSSLS